MENEYFLSITRFYRIRVIKKIISWFFPTIFLTLLIFNPIFHSLFKNHDPIDVFVFSYIFAYLLFYIIFISGHILEMKNNLLNDVEINFYKRANKLKRRKEYFNDISSKIGNKFIFSKSLKKLIGYQSEKLEIKINGYCGIVKEIKEFKLLL
jgi:hypothetical protein